MAETSSGKASSPDSFSARTASKALEYIQSMREYLRTERFDPKHWPAGGYCGLFSCEVEILEPVDLCYLWIQIHLRKATATEFRTRLDHVLKRWDTWLLHAISAYGNLGRSVDHKAWLAQHPDLRDELTGFREELHSIHNYLDALEFLIREKIRPTPSAKSKSPDAGAPPETKPTDLKSLEVIAVNLGFSRSWWLSRIRSDELHTYRPGGKAGKGPHKVSMAEATACAAPYRLDE